MFFKEQLLSASQYNVETTSNKLFAWGLGTSGQVGTVTYIYSIAQLSAGLSHTIALTSDNRILTWGLNSTGQLGTNDTLNRSFPVQVGLTGWRKVSAGSSFSVAVRADGALFTWGANASGQLGIGLTTNRSSPVQVGAEISWRNVDAGQDYVLATTNTLAYYAWGINTSGQLGDGTIVSRSTPSQVAYVPYDGSTNNLTLVLNNSAQVNTSLTPYNNSPANPSTNDVSYSLNLTRATATGAVDQVTSNSTSGFAIAAYTDYTIETWIYITAFNGSATIYTLGTLNTAAWQQMGVSNTGAIYWYWGAGSWMWNDNITSSTGLVTTNTWYHLAVVKQGTSFTIYRNGTVAATKTLAGIANGQGGTFYIGSYFGSTTLADYYRGYVANFRMVAGTAVYTGVFTPPTSPLTAISGTQILTSYFLPTIPLFSSISAGDAASYGITTLGLLYSWGSNASGQLGLSNVLNRSYPIQIGADSWLSVNAGTGHAAAIKDDSTLWTWGLNNVGQLGIGLTTNRSSPVQVTTVASWRQVSAGTSFTLGIGSNNLLYTWGLATGGQIGVIPVVNRSSPTQVTTGSWNLISAGGLFSVATNDNNLLYSWGTGAGGTQGDGTTIVRSSPTLVSFNQTISQSSPVQIGSESWTYISSGSNFFVALRSDNLLYSWGTNANGQLGDNSSITKSSPVLIGTSSWTAVAAGNSNSVFAIRSDGTLWTWGISYLANQTGGNVTTTSWKQITVNANTSLALRSDNTVWSWGEATFGQNANNSTINRSAPIQIGSDKTWRAIAENSSGSGLMAAIDTDYKLWVWGQNNVGQLANGNTINRSSPVLVMSDKSWSMVSGSFGITTDGALWGWGAGGNGQVGDGTTINKSSPVQLSSGTSFISVTARSNQGGHAFALSTDNKLYGWGQNNTGQLGTNDTINRSTPTTLSSPFDTYSWLMVSAGNMDGTGTQGGHTLAIRSDYSLYAWGLNASGQLGTSNTQNKSSPVQISYADIPASWAVIAASNSRSLAIDSNGYPYGWGYNAVHGAVGDNSIINKSKPVIISTFTWGKIAAGYFHSNIITEDGYLLGWGANNLGNQGNNTTIARSAPTLVQTLAANLSSPVQLSSGLSNFTQIRTGTSAHAAITSNGSLYMWGINTVGQLGTGTTLNRNVPQLLDNNSWNSVSVGYNHVVAIRNDNTLYIWGGNDNAQLGDNSIVNKSSPIQIGVGSSWIAAAAGNNYTLALRSDNILFAWGLNNAGQLGIVTDSYSWTQVAEGFSHSIAVRNDGTLWGWGLNSSGQLGLNDVLVRSSPTQIGTSSWTVVSSNNLTSSAIRSDGALFTWGLGTNLQIGDGFNITRSSPVQIGSSSWSQVNVGTSHTLAIDAQGRLFGWGIATALYSSTAPFSWTIVSENTSHTAAIRSDGLLFVWGLNTSGQVGDGTIVSKSSPIQIGTSSWISVSAGQNHTMAVTSDYRLFVWGNNSQYQLGDNSTVARSSPIQIGTALSWSQVDAANSFSMAITTNNLLYVWGIGTSGQLGSLTETYSWLTISAGASTSLAVRSDNRLYGWGLNTSFQIGDGTSITKSSPVQVGTSSWISVSSGVNHTLGITNNGELYGWGVATTGATGNYGEIYSWNMVSGSGANWYGIRSDGSLWVSGTNSLGQLGLNDTAVRSSPTQVGTSSWLFVNSGGGTNGNSVFGITTDYRLFVWGLNGNGQLGTNDIITRSSPIQVDSGNSYVFVTTGAQTLAIRTDGTLWATGINTTGQLGTNDVITRSNFVQVGNSSWTKVAAADGHTLAIRSDATLWTWGTAGTNQLGNNSTINRSSPVQVTSPGASPWIDIAGGFLYSVGITGAGLGTPYSAYVWGGNNNGATGLNTTVGNNALPTLMKAGSAGNSFVQVTTNWGGGSTPNTFIRSNNGQVWSMGHFLLIGNGVFGVSRSSPVLVAGSASWSQLPVTAQADGVMCAIDTNSTLWAWDLVPSYLTYAGANVLRVSAPIQVGGNIRWQNYDYPLYTINSQSGQGSWTSVSAGNSFSLGIKNNLAYGWGQNVYGQTGTNQTTTPIISPTQIGSSSWSVVSSSELGNFAGAITTDNKLYMWGSGTTQLALEYTVSKNSWVQISNGWSHIVGIKSDGSLWLWGTNNFGQLGDGTTITTSSPTQLGTNSWLHATAGNYQTYAISTDGTLWSWGYGLNGALGLGDIISRSIPTQIGANSWAQISANGFYGAYGISANGELYAWGANDFGQLGQLSVVNRSNPTLITSAISWNQVSAAGRFVAAIKSDFTLWTWGLGQTGQLGDNSIVSKSTPVQILGSWKQVVATGDQGSGNNAMAALRIDNTLWTWGAGAYTGQNSTIGRSSPTQVGSSYWTQLSSGGLSAFAIDVDQRLFVWGRNFRGSLGLNDTIDRSSPTLLSAPIGTSWTYLAKGNNNPSSINTTALNKALASDGNLYIWGDNSYYGLGLMDTIDRSAPVQLDGNWVQTNTLYSYPFLVPALPTYTSSPVQIGNDSWSQLSVGTSHSLAVRTDSTLWSWGFNTNSELGFSDTITRSSPTQIGTSSWTNVSAGFDHSMAIRSDGTLWGWGNNAQGQIGLFTETYSWIQLECRNSSTLAIRTDYTLWVWGLNTSGQLGLGDVINRSSPVQVSGSWQSIGVNTFHAGGIRTDGTLWMWGSNGSGQLGTNDTISTSSPVQVFGGDSWTQISLGLIFTLGIKTNGQGFAWGNGGSGGAYGWLGNGTSINRSSPTQISGGYSWTSLAANIGAGSQEHQSFGIRTDNILMTWGSGQDGMSGGAGGPLMTPSTIPGYTTTSWAGVYPGYLTVFAITSAGGLLVWGRNSNNVAGTGQSGGGVFQYNTPTGVAIVGATSRVEANESHAIALQSDGTLWGWGVPVNSTLLNFSNVSRSVPVQINTSSWSQIRTGLNSVFAIQDNKIFVWGNSSSGQGGTGYIVARSSPTQLGGNPNINTLSPVQIGTGSWSQVNAGNQYTLARDINNNLYAWGQDTSGQLGL